MKTIYTTFILSLMTYLCVAQVTWPPPPPSYEFGIVHLSNYDFKIIAIPRLESTDTDISDIGFTLMLPAGIADIINESGLLGGRVWTVQEFDAAFLSGMGLGDGTRDAFQFNLPDGQTILSHTNYQQIDLVSFQVNNSPNSGVMSFLLNDAPIAIGTGGVLDSFYNVSPGAVWPKGEYFSGLVSGMELFMFSTLNINDFELLNGLSVYPNPVSNLLTIDSEIPLTKVEIYSILGKKVKEINSDFNSIRTNNLSNGVYIFKIYSENGIATKKLIKK